jgi:two-component system KDP operon response regulator KdpE
MAIAWIATNTELHSIKSFRAAHWEIMEFTPVEFVQAKLSRPGDVEAIVFELSDAKLLDLCQDICSEKIAPMLVIVAKLAYAQAALEAGADDFLMMPADPTEVLLRVHKLVRASGVVAVGELEIDLAAWRVSHGGRQIRLSPVDFRLLACLAKQVGHMVTHAAILNEVWGWDSEQSSFAQVKNYIGRLRRKIEPDPHNPQYIISFPGVGYRLRNQRQWKEHRTEAERFNR